MDTVGFDGQPLDPFGVFVAAAGREMRLLSAKVAYLHAWWWANAGGFVPPRSAFDIVEHAAIIANIYILRYEAPGLIRCALAGEEVKRLVGHQRGGTDLEADMPWAFGRAIFQHYRAVLEGRTPVRCMGRLTEFGRDYARFEALNAPLSSDGESVDLIFGVIDAID